MTELEVRLSADISKLKSELAKANKAVSDFGTTAERQTGKSSAAFNKTGQGLRNVTPTLLEFNRVIQDAPFGILGVANNITQLTQNFGFLQAQAGGTLPALKALAAGFLGPAGILFVVSAATSLLVTYGDRLFKSTDEATKLAEANKKIAESLEKYRESLSGVQRARVEGLRGGADEIVQLRLLREQIENTSNSTDIRRDGIAKLRKEFPAYFKDVSDEKILNGQAASSYDILTNSIIKRAKATAAQSILVENSRKEILLNEQLESLNNKIGEAETKRAKARESFQESTKRAHLRGINPAVNAYVNEIAKGNDFLKEQVEIQKQLGDITKQNASLESLIVQNTIVEPTIDSSGVSKVKAAIEGFKNEFQNLDDIFGINRAAQKSLDNLNPIFDNFNVKFNKFGDIIQFQIKNAVKKATPAFSELENKIVEFNRNASEIIQRGTVSAFAAIGDAIGNALINGTNIFQGVGIALLRVVGQVATQLGEAAIAIGISMIAIKASFSNPYTAIAAGVALVAIGSALGAIATKAVNPSSSGTSEVSGQGSSGRSSFSGGGQPSVSSRGGEFVFRIRGRELIGVIENELAASKRLGGAGAIIP